MRGILWRWYRVRAENVSDPELPADLRSGFVYEGRLDDAGSSGGVWLRPPGGGDWCWVDLRLVEEVGWTREAEKAGDADTRRHRVT